MPTLQIEPVRTTSWGGAPTVPDHGDGIRHLSPAAQTAFARFQTDGDPGMLDPIMLGLLEHFAPGSPTPPMAGLAGSTRLIQDLGFDSLTMVEVVFFTEELFGISVTNAEVLQVHTLDDLRGFLRRKLTGRTPGAQAPPSVPYV